jgi:alanine racemase
MAVKRVVAEVDLGAIRRNVAAIRDFVGLRVDVMPVVKADAYGHGALPIARTAIEAGAEWIGVATVEEGAAIRKALPAATICLLSPSSTAEAEEIVVQRLVPFVSDVEGARELSKAGQRLRGTARVHLEVDTGMGRSGALPQAVVRLAEHIARMPSILVTGMATHFPSAEDDPEYTERQIALFSTLAEAITSTDTLLNHLHCANSAAILRYPSARFNLVRPGLLVYGIRPGVPDDVPIPEVTPALTLKSQIVLIRSLPAGHTLSYGRTHSLGRASRIATVPVGYGDGYPRALSNVCHVLVCGRRAPVVGSICMDVLLADVSEIPEAELGADVVLIGKQGELRVTAAEMARAAGTTEHDITTRLTQRVPRVYVYSQ